MPAFRKCQADICELACSQMPQRQAEPPNLRNRELLQKTELWVGQTVVVSPCERGMFMVQHKGLRPCLNRPPLLTACGNQVAELPSTDSEALGE